MSHGSSSNSGQYHYNKADQIQGLSWNGMRLKLLFSQHSVQWSVRIWLIHIFVGIIENI